MNYVSLLGRLTKDPELTYTQSGKAYLRFVLAVNRDVKKDEADFINCVAWEKRAEAISNFFKKGNRILIQGRISTGSYEKDGETRYSTDVIVSAFEFIENKSRDDENNYQSNYSSNKSIPTIEENEEMIEEDDDFPF